MLLPAAVVVVLAVAWVWLWYYAATIADRTMAGWVQREAAAGRVYSCGTQSIGGFPFGITARCTNADAEIKNTAPPFTANARAVVLAAEIYHPTRLTGEFTGPLTLAELGRPPSFIVDWSRARVEVRGIPPDPEGVSADLDDPRISAAGDGGASAGATLFTAKHADLHGLLIGGSPRDRPVIEAILHFVAATVPAVHPALGAPTDVAVDAVLRGLKDLSPKPWPERFRDMQAADGSIEIRSLKLTQGGAVVAGQGTLHVDDHGRLDGLVQVAVVGLDRIVPLLGIDRLVEQDIDRLAGSEGTVRQGMNALDSLVPGLGGALRDTASASLIETIKKMGEPTTIDNQAATLLPLRFVDGSVYLGMLRVGETPPLY